MHVALLGRVAAGFTTKQANLGAPRLSTSMRGSPHSLHSSSTIWPLYVDVGRERKDEACASFANHDKIGFLPKRPLRNRPGPRQSQHRHPPKPGARTTTGLVRRVYEEDPCHIQRHCAALRSFTEADLQLL